MEQSKRHNIHEIVMILANLNESRMSNHSFIKPWEPFLDGLNCLQQLLMGEMIQMRILQVEHDVLPIQPRLVVGAASKCHRQFAAQTKYIKSNHEVGHMDD
jgi:hypothetical protein